LLLCVFWLKFTDISEEFAASIIRVMALMMEAASTSETSVNFYQTHGAKIQKTATFILTAMRT
jgi:hypothetical protein